ncbi:response regulator [Marinobacterium arenosum]|uniref:response regulator n=1 Tax=Marinobacterium arenosum TaxID=2862496 RepID=UPI001C94AE61|nr:response regulator [Marinobacterium arenosum]MBY4676522.1 response regulator [Marinobacterium arenosum]
MQAGTFQTNRRAVAVLEDDPALREMWGWVLEEQELEVSLYANPQELQQAWQQGDSAPVLMLDLGLPPLPDSPEVGLALLEQLTEEYPLLKVIVLTGQNQEGNAYRAVRAGAFDFVAKPVGRELLLQSVERAFMFLQSEARLQWELGTRRLVLDAPVEKGMKDIRNQAEEKLLRAVVRETDFNVHEIARRLGIKRENVYYLLKKYGLSRD